MAVAEVDIANLALRMVKGGAITAIDDTTPAGKVIGDNYSFVRDDLLRAHPWNFALKRGGLIGFYVPKPEFEFERAYLLPTGNGGWKKALRVVDPDRGRSAYKVEQGNVLSNANGSPTNALSSQDDFTASDWTENNTGTVTANSTAGPDGTSDADLITDGDASNSYYLSQSVTIGDDDSVHFLGVKVAADDASYATLQCKMTGGSTTITAYIELDFSAGTLTKGGAQAGQIHSYDVLPLDNSFYWIWMGIKNNSTGNTTLTYELYPTGLASGAVGDVTGIYAVTAWEEKILPVDCRWIEKITDPDEMTEDFRYVLATALAVELAVGIAGSGTHQERMEKLLQKRLRRARSTDGIEDFPEQFPEGSWATSRRGRLSRAVITGT